MPPPHRAIGEPVIQLRLPAQPYAARFTASPRRRGGLASATVVAALLVVLALLAGLGAGRASTSVATGPALAGPGHVAAAAPADSNTPRIPVHRQGPAKRPRQASTTVDIPDHTPSAATWPRRVRVAGHAPVPPHPRGSATIAPPDPASGLPPGQAPPLRA